ncbi:MAG: sodium:solute symporter [Cyclobacteriaceae bacterium]|nr:sodium:solute symporter [Cyclobacteriaceae bacterium]
MNHLHWIDYVIIAGTVFLTVYMGVYFSKRQGSSDKYFSGGNSIPAWAIGISIFATLISSVTFLAYPSAAYKSNWLLLVQGLMVPIVLLGLIWLIVPLFRKVIRLSTYEYFEKRFGFLARIYGSVAFILTHFSKMGTVLYLVCLALSSMMGLDIFVLIFVLGSVIIILTLLGGIEAVIWMDVIQGFLLIGGGLFCLFILLFTPEGGPVRVIGEAFDLGKIGFGPYDWDFTQATFVVLVINGIFYSLQKYGTDQTIVQRYITARSNREARKAAYIGVLMSVPVWTLFMLIGSALFVFYRITDFQLPDHINADAAFPYFIMTRLPVGVTGLVVAAIAAAAISSLDSDMNCLAAVGVEDYYQRMRPDCSDADRLRVGRILVVLSGLASMFVAGLYAVWKGEGVLGVVFELYAIFSAGIVGIFLLGLFSRRASKTGLYTGLVVCMIFTAYAVLSTTYIGSGADKRLIIDFGAFNFPHHKYMLGVYSHIIVFVVGYLVSMIFPAKHTDPSLTIYGYLNQKGI